MREYDRIGNLVAVVAPSVSMVFQGRLQTSYSYRITAPEGDVTDVIFPDTSRSSTVSPPSPSSGPMVRTNSPLAAYSSSVRPPPGGNGSGEPPGGVVLKGPGGPVRFLPPDEQAHGVVGEAGLCPGRADRRCDSTGPAIWSPPATRSGTPPGSSATLPAAKGNALT